MTTRTTRKAAKPDLTPPRATAAQAASAPSRPAEQQARRNGAGPARPTITPSRAGSVALAAGVTAGSTWTTGVTVDATWSIDEARNAFFHVVGGEWKKVFNGSDGAFTVLVALVAQAKQTGHQVSFREEPDGLVHEIYLW